MQTLYTAPGYTLTASPACKMALALDEQSCAVAIHDQNGVLQFLGHKNFTQPIQHNETVFFDFIREQDELKAKYNATHIVLAGEKSTTVPKELFDELYIDGYLRHMYTTDGLEIVKPAPLESCEAILVFAAKEYLYYPVRSKYYEAIIEPRSAHYIRQAEQYPDKLNVFFEKNTLYLVHFTGKNLTYYNAFAYTSTDEAVYFILNYYKVFNINGTALSVLLHGEIHPQVQEMLATYTHKTEIARQTNKTFDLPRDFEYGFLIDYCY